MMVYLLFIGIYFDDDATSLVV